MDPATGLFLVSSAFSMAEGITGAFSNYKKAKQEEKVIKANMQLVRQRQDAARKEKALNVGRARANALSSIDAARARMAAQGNIGSSAQAAVEDALYNMSADLSSMRYNYDSKISSLENEYNNLQMQKSAARSNKTSALIGGGMSVLGKGTSIAASAYEKFNKKD